jgi:uncharacterized membrane protein YedE/YeeE
MSNFTPLSSALGGALIGASASVLLLLDGKVAGVSGILGGVLRPSGGDRIWRGLFLAGLILAGAISAWLWPSAIGPAPPFPLYVLAGAGLLVGIGTELGSGCTSGHGVCGLSRGSMRSVAATLTFMATGVATAYVLRHLLGAHS